MSVSMGQLGDRFNIAANKLGPVSEKNLATLAQLGVGYVKEEIQSMHAVDTGTMLNSTQAERASSNMYLIGPTVFYAPYVALGTSRVEGRPFHITAARRLMEDNKDLFTVEDLGL